MGKRWCLWLTSFNFFFFLFPFSLPFRPPAPPPPQITASTKIRCCCLVVTHHSMEHPVPQFLEEPTKTWKLIRISRRNFSVASCFTQVLHLQEQVLPLGEISKASMARVNLQQSQTSVMSYTLQLPQWAISSPCPDRGWSLLSSRWMRQVYNQCCNTSAPKENGTLTMSFRHLKGDKIMQCTLKMGQYVTPLNTTLFPNIAYTVISKTGVPVLSSPALGNCTPSRGCTNWKERSSTTVISAQ